MRAASLTNAAGTMRSSRIGRAAQELLVIAAVAWIVLVAFREGTPSGFAGSWIAYTWTIAVIDFVLLPVVPVLAIGIPLVWYLSPQPNYWAVYRLASVVAVVWLLGAGYGLWRMQYG